MGVRLDIGTENGITIYGVESITSDISGKEINTTKEDVYLCDDTICTYDELFDLLNIRKVVGQAECNNCGEEPNEYYEYNGKVWCKKCLRQELEDDYKTTVDKLGEREFELL